MSEPNLRIVRPQANAAPDDDKMVVQLTVGEFRQLIADTVKETMNSKRRNFGCARRDGISKRLSRLDLPALETNRRAQDWQGDSILAEAI
jgi:hypothetical protein